MAVFEVTCVPSPVTANRRCKGLFDAEGWSQRPGIPHPSGTECACWQEPREDDDADAAESLVAVLQGDGHADATVAARLALNTA